MDLRALILKYQILCVARKRVANGEPPTAEVLSQKSRQLEVVFLAHGHALYSMSGSQSLGSWLG